MEYRVINISETDEKGLSFAGVSNIKDTDKTQIVVPFGYQMPSSVSDTDETNMSALKRYVKVIQKALHTYRAKEEAIDFSKGMNSPLAAVNIIQDYLSLGSYIEYDKTQQESRKGKIDFKRTIKNIRPKIVDDTLFYDSFIVQKKVVIKDNLTALVQGKVINHFMTHGGDVLFGQTLRVPCKDIGLDEKLVRLLREELNNTFVSRKQNLIRWSIEYINGLMNPDYEERGDWNYAIKASSLWEIIVDSIFGNQKVRDKKEFGKIYNSYSFSGGIVGKGQSTEHDTIYEDDEYLFVIDSKMYQYQDRLLSEEVLGKQFGYYIEAKKKRPTKKVINVLLVPYISGKDGFQNCYIPDPHTPISADPDKIIFIYACPVNGMIDDYYYGRKRIGQIRSEFDDFIKTTDVRNFLNARGTSY